MSPDGQRTEALGARPLLTVAAARAVIVTVIAASGAFLGDTAEHHEGLFVFFALGWLPAALVAFIASDEPRSPVARFSGSCGDIAAMAVLVAALPEQRELGLVGMVLAAAMATLTWPLALRWIPTAAAVAATAAALTLDGWTRAEGVTLLVAAVAMVTLDVLVNQLLLREREAHLATVSQRGRVDTIMTNVPHPVVLTGPGGRVTAWNEAATSLVVGGISAGATCAATLRLHVGERELQCDEGCSLAALCRDEPDSALEVWRPLGGGRRQPMLASAAVIKDARGKTVEVVHSMRDITRLKEADEAKTLFLATASHELKTPLTVISGFADMLLARPTLDGKIRLQALEAIATRSRELARIVDRLLLSSRIESGRATVRLNDVDVEDVIAERVRELSVATGRVIALHVAPGLPFARADRTALTTVLDHLLDNAIKYSPGGEPVDVDIRSVRGHVVLAVSDRGIGMSPVEAQRCFDKFWQADNTDSRQYGGTGIGLYIVRSLVESMGGRVETESVNGVGTTFAVTLPAADAIPGPRTVEPPAEPSMIREFMRQIGVPSSDGGDR